MIETEFFILTEEMVAEHAPEAERLGITLDHYFLEWLETEGEWVYCD